MSDDSSDEDVPLGQLIQKKAPPAVKSAPPALKSSPAPPKKKVKAEEPAKKKAKVSSTKSEFKPVARAAKGSIKNDCDVFYETLKGQLVQKLECRWWYAIEWPSKADLSKPVPAGYQQLDGFPGVHICVKGEKIGKIIDNRNPKTCPNFKNLCKKTSEELRDLLKTALEKQKEQLLEHEGAGSSYMPDINKDLDFVRDVNCAKADKAAAKLA